MCKCKDVQVGTYGNSVTLKLPKCMLPNLNCLGENKGRAICIDTCIAEEIQHLWSLEIHTTGCCCGHNIQSSYIGVIDSDIPKMKALGYRVQFNPNRPLSEDTFDAKTCQ